MAKALTLINLPWRVVVSASALISWKWELTKSTTLLLSRTPLVRKTGARVISSLMMRTSAPPAALMAEQPRFTEAMSAPSVVAMGTKNSPLAWSPLMSNGPTKPKRHLHTAHHVLHVLLGQRSGRSWCGRCAPERRRWPLPDPSCAPPRPLWSYHGS